MSLLLALGHAQTSEYSYSDGLRRRLRGVRMVYIERGLLEAWSRAIRFLPETLLC